VLAKGACGLCEKEREAEVNITRHERVVFVAVGSKIWNDAYKRIVSQIDLRATLLARYS